LFNGGRYFDEKPLPLIPMGKPEYGPNPDRSSRLVE